MKSIHGDEQMYLIEIILPCPECSTTKVYESGEAGSGTIYYQRVVDNSDGKDYSILEVQCESCNGTGEWICEEEYESKEQAEADYPNSIECILIRNR